MSNLRRMMMASGSLVDYPKIDNNLTLLDSFDGWARVLPIDKTNQIFWSDLANNRNFAILDSSGTEERENQFLNSQYVALGIPSTYKGYAYIPSSAAAANDGNIFSKINPTTGFPVWENKYIIDGITGGVRSTDNAAHVGELGAAFILNENNNVSYLILLDQDGNHVFTRKFTLPSFSTHTDVLVTDDAVYLAFYTSFGGTARLFKFSGSGIGLWDKKYTNMSVQDCHPSLQYHAGKLYYGLGFQEGLQGGVLILEINPVSGSVVNSGKLYCNTITIGPDTQGDGNRISQKWMVVDDRGITVILKDSAPTDIPVLIFQCNHEFTNVNWSRKLSKTSRDMTSLSIYRIQNGYFYSGHRGGVAPSVQWVETCNLNGESNNNVDYVDYVVSTATVPLPTEAPEGDTVVSTPSVVGPTAPLITGSSTTSSITIVTTW